MAAKKRVKVQEHENLTSSNIEKVIALLEATKPITKKEACEILNISYNTTRLTNIIESHKASKAREKKLRDANRGKPASKDEIQLSVEGYLNGESIADISKKLYRSPSFVKAIIERLGVPFKTPKHLRATPAILPDQCVANTFEPGQKAWSAVYHAPCEIVKEIVTRDYESKYGSKCYQIYVLEPVEELQELYPSIEKGGFFAYSVAHQLGSLKHLEELGIKL